MRRASPFRRFVPLLSTALALGVSAGIALAAPSVDGRPVKVQSPFVVAAATCGASDVQTALDATPDGGTVSIPAGDCDWGAAHVTRLAGVAVHGAGRGATTIRRTAAVTQANDFLLAFDCSNGLTVELSDLTVVGNDDLQSEPQRLLDYDNGVALLNGCVDFEVHDVEIEKFSVAGLTIRGRPQRGVVYESSFTSNFKCQTPATDCYGYGVAVYGDGTAPPLALGTRDAVFLEDDVFTDNRHGVASNYGSRYVVRHSVFVATQRTRDYALIDAHGRQSPSLIGSRSWEIYDNLLRTDPPSMIADGIGLRGGDGVIFGNTLQNIPYTARLNDESCSGTYPLPDQTRSAYVWDNSWQPIPGYGQDAIWVDTACQPYLQENRDWFRTARPGYAPYAYPHPLRGTTAAVRLYTVAPCRLADTRRAAGALGGPALAAGEERTLPITSACGLPADAKAVAVNVTAVAPGAQGTLSLFPGDQSAPRTNVLGFRAGGTRAGAAVVALAFDGAGTVRVKNISSAAVDVVLDLSAYFR